MNRKRKPSPVSSSKLKKQDLENKNDCTVNAQAPESSEVKSRKRSSAIKLPIEETESDEYETTKKILEQHSGTKESTSNLVSTIFAFKAPPFKEGMEGSGYESNDYRQYSAANYEKRRAFLKNRARQVRRGDEHKFFIHEQIKMKKRIRDDPELRTRLKQDVAKGPILGQCLRLIGQRVIMTRSAVPEKGVERLLKESKTPKFGPYEPKDIQKYGKVYIPPEYRIKIMENITFNANDVIPVYSDIPGETLDTLNIPDSLLFDYTDLNIVNRFSEKRLSKAITMSQKKQNTIQCECCSSEPIVPCYENENCPCYKMNEKMRNIQIKKDKLALTEFSTFKPIYFTHVKNQYYNYIGFACSDLCKCSGNCTNNSLYIPNKKIYPIEMYRNNPNIGFIIRCPVLIPAGTPLIEFTGELVEHKRLERTSSDYSYQVTYANDTRIKILLEETEFDEDYKSLLRCLLKQDFSIDPKIYGNIGRTAGHACVPNMDVVRIYQKSLSPAHLHLVLVALEDIFPGTPLTIDYGWVYTKILSNVCDCGTFACRNNKEAKIFSKVNFTAITSFLKDIHAHRCEEWHDKVLDKVYGREKESGTSSSGN